MLKGSALRVFWVIWDWAVIEFADCAAELV
jgi:hypothetical protein